MMQDTKNVTMYAGTEDEYESVLEVPPRPWSIEPHDGTDKAFAILDANGSLVFYMDYDDVFHEQQDFIAEFIVNKVNNA